MSTRPESFYVARYRDANITRGGPSRDSYLHVNSRFDKNLDSRFATLCKKRGAFCLPTDTELVELEPCPTCDRRLNILDRVGAYVERGGAGEWTPPRLL